MQLLEDRVLIKPYPVEDVSTGGIIIPETAKHRPKKGKVIAVGTGYTVKEGNLAGSKIPFTVKVGDDVLYEGDAGEDMEMGEEKVVMMLETNIRAII